MAAILAEPDTRARLDALGAEPVADTPDAFAAFARAEYERWGALVRDAGITAD